MNKKYPCSDEDCQEWPRQGKLKKNMNLEKKELIDRLRGQSGETHRYIVTSIRNEKCKLAPAERFIQTGCGPNFQGDLITLCTCRPDLRSKYVNRDWVGKWIVGFTSKRLDRLGRHYMFYLMKISEAFQSQAEIWKELPSDIGNAKSARKQTRGDIFEPILEKIISKDDEWKTENYHPDLIKGHVHAKAWHRDIKYPIRNSSRNRQSFLTGDVAFSFLWSKPLIWYKGELTPPINPGPLKDVQDLIPDFVEV